MTWLTKQIQQTLKSAADLHRSAEIGNYETCGTEEQWN
jgi:hypothetical protein